MNRRRFTALLAGAHVGGLAGCVVPEITGPDSPHINIRAEVVSADGSWTSTIRIRNLHGSSSPAHGVSLLVFDVRGNQLYLEDVGDIPDDGGTQLTESTFVTTEFPAIQTATAEESPCDGARIEVNYWDEDVEDLEVDGIWRDVHRECDEPIPPQSVLDEVDERAP